MAVRLTNNTVAEEPERSEGVSKDGRTKSLVTLAILQDAWPAAMLLRMRSEKGTE